ncbi:MAG: phosphatidylserine decarboxylase [Sulfuricurvum sp.]
MSRVFSSAVSQTFGKFASKRFAPSVQSFINKSYVKLMGLDMSEFRDPSTYESLNALFTRHLEAKRELEDGFISPCDALITEAGKMESRYAMQIKGMYYNVDEFLGEAFRDEAVSVHNGDYINLYLSPSDYHRYHIPIDLKVLKASHIVGKFYPVNLPSLKKRANLFVENERVVLLCESMEGKRFFMVLVSALNVGVMSVSFDDRIQTNASSMESKSYEYKDLYLKKGDDFGSFEMGSTIIILAEDGMLDLSVKAGEKTSFGKSLASLL